MDPMFTINPDLCWTMCGTTSLLIRKGAQKLISNCRVVFTGHQLQSGVPSSVVVDLSHRRFATLVALDVCVQQSAGTSSAGIVDEDVDPTLFAQDLVHGLFTRFERADVEFEATDARRQRIERGQAASRGVDDAIASGKLFAQRIAAAVSSPRQPRVFSQSVRWGTRLPDAASTRASHKHDFLSRRRRHPFRVHSRSSSAERTQRRKTGVDTIGVGCFSPVRLLRLPGQ